MAASSTGVEAYLDKLSDESTPWCPHGPTILFERYTSGSLGKRFYACGACRDRRECSFFQWEDAEVTDNVEEARRQEYIINKPKFSSDELYKRKETFLTLAPEERNMCVTCGLLLLPNETQDHPEHQLKHIDNMEDLTKPSILLPPIENNKTNAQYLFADGTVDFVVDTIPKLGYSNVLCIGTPRIHEVLLTKPGAESFLLDMDYRLGQFFPSKTYSRYNMFNHHFFEGDACKERLSKFLQSSKDLIVLVDPPFGGLVSILAATLDKIAEEWNRHHKQDSVLPVLLFFPYFIEGKIKEHLKYHMLDYKVNYTNHITFQAKRNSGGKHGSPVRIFTNMSLSHIELPEEEGYRFCKDCQRWVAQENKHCEMCENCTSKDGRTYKHCMECARCVKPSYVHCEECKQCALLDHRCGQGEIKGCFICGDVSHKRRECPNREPPTKRKKKKRSKRPQEPTEATPEEAPGETPEETPGETATPVEEGKTEETPAAPMEEGEK